MPLGVGPAYPAIDTADPSTSHSIRCLDFGIGNAACLAASSASIPSASIENAARHFRISRVGDKTRIVALEDEARLEEIARMLSGAQVTDEARAAAKRLVAEAARPKKTRKRAQSA